MEQKYRFAGTKSQIGDRELTKLGEEIMLTASEARNAIEGHCPLVPDAAFRSVGFTDDELRRYATPGGRADMPPAVEAKLRQAWGLIGVAEEEEAE